MAWLSSAATTVALSTATLRPASTFSVGSLSGEPRRNTPQPASTLAAAQATSSRSGPRGTLALSVGTGAAATARVDADGGAVVELRHREARLRHVAGEALLL